MPNQTHGEAVGEPAEGGSYLPHKVSAFVLT
jgi:hypothetical protein